ncbi:kinase-like domain-containing protein [Gloeopeniophorella convolvens]|nr:kinase-like domain-containing protein [Gloeopeniophorella convolvens]
MDPDDLQVMSHPPFDPAIAVRITHRVQQGRAADTAGRGIILNQYLRGPSVGKGQHGTVYKCWDLTQNNTEVAIKVVSRHNPRADRLNQLKRKKIPRSGPHLPVTDNLGSQEYKIRKEIAVMKLCRHPHVVRLLEVIDDKLYQKVYMVMEFLGGGEIKWRDQEGNPVLRVDQSRRICRDVILGLEYLHFQGIIHRDIKPANLMWTSDRRTVKITDFGVAHISAAQRFAGSGKDQSAPGPTTTNGSDADLQLLFDDSELCKTAGTPSFLAPEVIYDFGTEVPLPSSSEALADGSNSATTLHAPPPHRPPITKAIDVWALGVTLYCLLFGKTPFRVESNHEFALYGVICTQDWDVEPFMGQDRIPAQGRHHKCLDDKPCSEGAEIIKLLERILEKDASKRVTLNEVKRHRWFLRDIPDHARWVRETVPDSKISAAVTEDAISDAVSPMRFRWRQRLTNRLSSLLRTVRPQRSFRSADGHSDSDDVGVRSLPTVSMSRYATKKDAHTQTHRRPRAQQSAAGASAQPTGKQRQQHQHPPETSSSRTSSTAVHRSAADLSRPPARSKSTDTRPLAASNSTGGLHLSKAPTRRRGSGSLLAAPDPGPGSASVRSFSPGGGGGELDTRPKSRFSFTSLRWRRDAPSQTSAPATPPAPQSAVPPAVLADISAGAGAGAAMRASSWGDVGEYGRLAAHDAASLHSGAGDAEEPLDADVVVVGAGGFALAPLPPTPSGSAGALVPSPRVRLSFSSEDGDGDGDGAGSDGDSDDDSDSFFARNSEDAHARARRAAALAAAVAPAVFRHSGGAAFGTDYGDEEEEEEVVVGGRCGGAVYVEEDSDVSGSEEGEEEGPPIEVRRRRPSWAVHDEPPESDDDDDDDDDGKA